MSSDYDHLTLMQKVEVFEQAIDSTSGDDLAKVLWLKSPSSEVRADTEREGGKLVRPKFDPETLYLLSSA